MTELELYHYGVKGMKWGVRRNIGVKARAAAYYRRDIDAAKKNVNRLERKKDKKGLNARQSKRLEMNKKIASTYEATRNKLIKDLSPKDIKQGERQIRNMAISSIFLYGGVLGSIDNALTRTVTLQRADAMLNGKKEEVNKPNNRLRQ